MGFVGQKVFADCLLVVCGILCIWGAKEDNLRDNRKGALIDLIIGFAFITLGISFFIVNTIRY